MLRFAPLFLFFLSGLFFRQLFKGSFFYCLFSLLVYLLYLLSLH